jgi:hypothetical protein
VERKGEALEEVRELDRRADWREDEAVRVEKAAAGAGDNKLREREREEEKTRDNREDMTMRKEI